MKKAVAVVLAALGAYGLQAVSVDQVIVRQQWPWNKLVKIEYRLAGQTGAVNINIAVSRNGTPVEVPAQAFTGDVFAVKNGFGTITMDPTVAFGGESAKIRDLKFELTAVESAASLNEVLYRVFDLTSETPSYVDITRADLLNGKYGAYETDYSKIGEGYTTSLSDVLIWTGVTNDIAYKTTKLVMRKIPAGGKVWKCGCATSYAKTNERYVKLTQDYFISVFEITQKQWELAIQGTVATQYLTPSYFTGLDDSDIRPVERVFYYMRGNPVPGDADRGVVTGEKINWPTNSYVHDVGKNYPMSIIWKRTGCEFDLPTEVQWEYACRAGTEGAVLYNGKTEKSKDNVEELGWINTAGQTTHAVGQKKPNAYGLYDMYGNVMEMTLNAGDQEYLGGTTEGDGLSAESPIVDPVGSSNVADYDSAMRTKRGGSYGCDYPEKTDGNLIDWYMSTSYERYRGYQWSLERSDMGFRFVCPATANGQWGEHPAQ